jgi:hypothetical protein
MILRCTGGGILVPIFLNLIPVPLAQDAYPIAIFLSFLMHEYFPVLREVVALSSILKAALIVLYEVMRASVVYKLTLAAGKAIAPSDFEFAIFGPIFCGTIGGVSPDRLVPHLCVPPPILTLFVSLSCSAAVRFCHWTMD